MYQIFTDINKIMMNRIKFMLKFKCHFMYIWCLFDFGLLNQVFLFVRNFFTPRYIRLSNFHQKRILPIFDTGRMQSCAICTLSTPNAYRILHYRETNIIETTSSWFLSIFSLFSTASEHFNYIFNKNLSLLLWFSIKNLIHWTYS